MRFFFSLWRTVGGKNKECWVEYAINLSPLSRNKMLLWRTDRQTDIGYDVLCD
jgi:hypothetical protein